MEDFFCRVLLCSVVVAVPCCVSFGTVLSLDFKDVDLKKFNVSYYNNTVQCLSLVAV